MYELKLDKKILSKSRKKCIILGCLLFFFIGFGSHLLLNPPRNFSAYQVLRGSDRMTASILMAILGAFVGAGFSRGNAINMQRRRDLKVLIEQGKK